MKKVLLILAVSILVVYAAIAALMLDLGGIFSGSANPNDPSFTVNLVLNDASIGGRASIEGGTAQFEVDEDFTLSQTLPTAVPNNKAFVFGGWFVEGTRVYSFADVQIAKGKNTTVQAVAYWTFKSFIIGETMFEVIMDLQHGQMYASNYDIARFGSLDKELPVPFRSGYLFGGWYYEGIYADTHRVETLEDIVPVWEDDNRPNSIKLVASWNVRPLEWWEK